MPPKVDPSSSSGEVSNAASAASTDTPVSQAQLNQAMMQLARMQQDTMQNVHQIQVSLQHLQSHNPYSSTGSSSINPLLVPPTTSIPGYVKLAKPSIFTGATKTNVETWLFEVEQYLIAYGMNSDSQRIAFATSFLKGLALQWWQNHCITTPGLTLSWSQFKEEVRNRFQPVAASKLARVNLKYLKQGNKSVADYCSMFYAQLQLITDGMTEADKVEYFMSGLSSTIFSEVDRRDPTTLQEAMTYAQRTELRSRVRSQHGFGIKPWSRYQSSSSYPRFSSHETSNSETSKSSTHPSTPMELGKIGIEEEFDEELLEEEYEQYLNELEEEELQALNELDLKDETPVGEEDEFPEPKQPSVQLQGISTRGNQRRVPNLSKEEYFRLRSEGRCYRCKGVGHLSRDCPRTRRPQPNSQRRNGGTKLNQLKH